MKRALITAVVVLSLSGHTKAEDWSEFHECLRQHASSAEQAEPSLHDAARLIVDVLCIKDATNLGNEMAKDPERRGLIQDKGFGGAFNSFLSVMRREATEFLFFERKRRLGL